MMATGTTDPIRRATEKSWSNTLPLLTIEGSAGPDNAADAIYCQVYGGAECASWYTNPISTTDGNCKIGEANELSVRLHNHRRHPCKADQNPACAIAVLIAAPFLCQHFPDVYQIYSADEFKKILL